MLLGLQSSPLAGNVIGYYRCLSWRGHCGFGNTVLGYPICLDCLWSDLFIRRGMAAKPLAWQPKLFFDHARDRCLVDGFGS